MSPAPFPTTTESEGALPVVLGHVVRAYGLKGTVVVRTEPSARDAFRPGLEVTLVEEGSPRRQATIAGLRAHRSGALLELRGIEDRNAAEAIVGSTIVAERRHLPSPSATEFYACDLVGSTVIGPNSESIGVLVEILETGANDVWVVHGDLGEWLIPAVAHAVLAVDRGTKTIVIDPQAATRSDP